MFRKIKFKLLDEQPFLLKSDQNSLFEMNASFPFLSNAFPGSGFVMHPSSLSSQMPSQMPSRMRLNVSIYQTTDASFNPLYSTTKNPEMAQRLQILVVLSGQKSITHLRHRLARSFEMLHKEQGQSQDG